VTRAEFDALVRLVQDCCQRLDVQFHRTAQLQAEVDQVRAAWTQAPKKR